MNNNYINKVFFIINKFNFSNFLKLIFLIIILFSLDLFSIALIIPLIKVLKDDEFLKNF